MSHKPVWVVTDVKANEDYTLLITFVNGEKRLYNALPLLDEPVYSPLKNLSFFMKARAEHHSVVWNDDLDIAPEHLYDHSKPVSDSST